MNKAWVHMAKDIYIKAREFGYVNARLRAARPHLLSRETLESLCEVESVDSMLELLLNTAYGPYIDKLRTKYGGFELISKVVMERFSKKVAQIEGMVRDERKAALLYAATGKLEAYNLRMLFLEAFRGAGYSPDYIEAGRVSGRRLGLLRDVEDVALLKKIVSDMGYPIHKESEKYVEIVDDIERAYYERLNQLKSMCGDEPEVRMYIEKMIDYKNFDLALRRMKGNIAEPKFLEGGSVHESVIRKAMGGNAADVAEVFGIGDLYEKYGSDPSWLEEMYDRKLLEWAMSTGAAEPFSMIGIIGFIKRLDVERRNIRSIAIAKNILSADEIKKRIIW